MNDLSPEARALLELASGEDSPSTEDRVRVRRALAASLAAGVVSSSATAAAASKSALAAAAGGSGVAAKSTAGLWLTVGVVAGLAGSATMYLSAPDTPSRPSFAPPQTAAKTTAVAPRQPPPPVAPEAPATAAAAPEVPAPPVTVRPPIARTASGAGKGSVAAPLPAPAVAVDDVSRAAPPVSKPAVTSLAPETALLESARTALGRGDAPGALALLERHEREFPTGALLEERLAAKVFALCSLGRREEAARAASRLLRISPASPLRARILDSCAYDH